MYNPVENAGLFLLTYTFTDENGNIIYQSEPKEGGEKWNVNFYDMLDAGEHKVFV